MRLADLDIVIVPGWSSSGPDHWQTRWETKFKTARRIEQEDWLEPKKDDWVSAIEAELRRHTTPTLVVAHSLGVIAAAHALDNLGDEAAAHVHGAFLVAPADVENADKWPVTRGQTFIDHGPGFAPIPMNPLTIPSVVIASDSDPYCSEPRAKELAQAWGASFVEAGDAGHINVDSGHGPWPEGLMRIGWFLKQIEDSKPTRH
ncbi:MAG: alpha/beta hydrolase [Pseudomonadota bacterium]